MNETKGTPQPAARAPRRGPLARLGDRVVASDPAFSRLRLALRAVLSLVLTGLLLTGLTFFHKLPIAAYGLAVILSFMASTAVRDKTLAGQALTRLYSGVAGVTVITCAGLLSTRPLLADAAFLAVIFVAVYIRKFGPRYFAVGLIAFMAFFMGDYLRPAPDQAGWIALATAIALAMTHLVGAVLLTDDPERDFRRAVSTIGHRINLMLADLGHAARRGSFDPGQRKEFQAHVGRFRDIVLMAEGFIPQGKGGALAGSGPASELALSLFDLQLAVERLVAASIRALPPAWLVEAVLDGDEEVIAGAAGTLAEAGEDNETAVQQVLIRVHRARQRLEARLRARPIPAFAAGGAGSTGAPPAEPAADQPPLAGFIPASYRIPIQVTLASAMAIAGGVLISSTRWYWAAIAAFIVFNNTRSRADTAVRALSRSAGTLAGIVAGTVLATLVHGNVLVSLAGILAMFFLAFYYLQTSYGLMIFFLTIAIALLYGIMGLFTPELLVVRLEETVVGALSGAFCAFFVFPVRAVSGVTEALDAYLDSLSKLVTTARDRVHGKDPHSDIVALSRAIDRKYADLAALARPLGGPWTIVTRYGEVREKLLLLAGCAHWSRVLARGISKGEEAGEIDVGRFDRLAEQLTRRIAHAKQTKRRFFLKASLAEDSRIPEAPRRSLAIREDESPVLALEVMSALLARSMSGVWRGGG